MLVSLLTACSSTFTYNQLDWLIPWYMDDYVDLDRDQKDILKVKLDPLLRWHRYQELDEYITILDRIEQDLEKKVTTESVQSWVAEIRQAGNRVEISFLKMTLELGVSLNDEQVNEFRESLRQSQQDYEEEYLDRDAKKYSKDSYKSLSKNLRRFVGRLTPEQKLLLKQASDSLQRFDSAWLADRELWLQQLDTLLKREPRWQQDILDAHSNRERTRTPEYQSILRHNAQTLSEAIALLLNQLDEKQTKRLMKEIDDLRNDLQNLINKPDSVASLTYSGHLYLT
jgi:hypothetical protein